MMSKAGSSSYRFDTIFTLEAQADQAMDRNKPLSARLPSRGVRIPAGGEPHLLGHRHRGNRADRVARLAGR
jgi:hypothetical protein